MGGQPLARAVSFTTALVLLWWTNHHHHHQSLLHGLRLPSALVVIVRVAVGDALPSSSAESIYRTVVGNSVLLRTLGLAHCCGAARGMSKTLTHTSNRE